MHEQGFMCDGLYWVGVDFIATFCVEITDPIDGKEQNHIFLFMFVHSVLLIFLVLGIVIRKVIESYFFD